MGKGKCRHRKTKGGMKPSPYAGLPPNYLKNLKNQKRRSFVTGGKLDFGRLVSAMKGNRNPILGALFG